MLYFLDGWEQSSFNIWEQSHSTNDCEQYDCHDHEQHDLGGLLTDCQFDLNIAKLSGKFFPAYLANDDMYPFKG